MDAREGLTPAEPSGQDPAPRSCPDCSEPASGPPAVVTSLLGAVPITRCGRCGCRYAVQPRGCGPLTSCGDCGLPYFGGVDEGNGDARCSSCRGDSGAAAGPETPLAEATEHEIRTALQSRWRFLDSPSASVYLDKVLRQLARRLPDAPEACRVVLFADEALRTLALPSGTILVSQGTLDELEDEAQLAFVLAHELIHVTSGGSTAAMLRLGMGAMAREEAEQEDHAWADASEDLIKLGHGRPHELEADQRALDAVLAAGYDPGAVVRYLQHLETLGERGDPKAAELALAHPPPRERLMRIERRLSVRQETGAVGLVNREVFRRAAGRHAETVHEAAPVTLWGRDANDAEEDSRAPRRWSGFGYLLLVAALIVLLFALGSLF